MDNTIELTRKTRSEYILNQKKIPINAKLPLPRRYDQIKPAPEVAKRVLILLALMNVVRGNRPKEILVWLKKEKLMKAASPFEKNIFENNLIDENERIEISWQAEAIWVLLWALGIIPDLGSPLNVCQLTDPRIAVALPRPPESTFTFIERVSLRSSEEILETRDLIYRMHWAVKEALRNNENMPAAVNKDIVYEWHYALNWLADPTVQWQSVKTNT